VGSGSDRHDLSGSVRTSSVIVGRKVINELPAGHGVNDGGSAPAVAARTPATCKTCGRGDKWIHVA